MFRLISRLLGRAQRELLVKNSWRETPDPVDHDLHDWLPDKDSDPETDEEDTMLPEKDRPNPLSDAATKVGGVWSAIGGLVGMLAIFGVLSGAQADAVRAAGESASPVLLALGALIGGITPLITGLLAAFRTAKSAKADVTPIADPRVLDLASGELVALVPSSPGRHARGDVV